MMMAQYSNNNPKTIDLLLERGADIFLLSNKKQIFFQFSWKKIFTMLP